MKKLALAAGLAVLASAGSTPAQYVLTSPGYYAADPYVYSAPLARSRSLYLPRSVAVEPSAYYYAAPRSVLVEPASYYSARSVVVEPRTYTTRSVLVEPEPVYTRSVAVEPSSYYMPRAVAEPVYLAPAPRGVVRERTITCVRWSPW